MWDSGLVNSKSSCSMAGRMSILWKEGARWPFHTPSRDGLGLQGGGPWQRILAYQLSTDKIVPWYLTSVRGFIPGVIWFVWVRPPVWWLGYVCRRGLFETTLKHRRNQVSISPGILINFMLLATNLLAQMFSSPAGTTPAVQDYEGTRVRRLLDLETSLYKKICTNARRA